MGSQSIVVMANTGLYWTELIFLFLLTFHQLTARAAPANFWWWDDPAYDVDFVYDFGGNLGNLGEGFDFMFNFQIPRTSFRRLIMVIDASLRNFPGRTDPENEKEN